MSEYKNTIVTVAASWLTAGQLSAFIDGVEDTTTNSYDGTMGTGVIGVGCRSDGTNQWDGTIKNVAFFDVENANL